MKFEVKESNSIYDWKNVNDNFHVAILPLSTPSGSYVSHALYIAIGESYIPCRVMFYLKDGDIRKPTNSKEFLKGKYFGDVIGHYTVENKIGDNSLKENSYKIDVNLEDVENSFFENFSRIYKKDKRELIKAYHRGTLKELIKNEAF